MANHFLMFRKRKKNHRPPVKPFEQMTHQEVVREMSWLMDRLGVPRIDKPVHFQLHKRAA